MKDMHEAGYAHRDLKPANVILLPRENRWTVIDFGCAARIGSLAPLAFTLTYAPPEVLRASEAKEVQMEVAAAVDVWALGVMAFELLTGAPAFRIVTDGIVKVCIDNNQTTLIAGNPFDAPAFELLNCVDVLALLPLLEAACANLCRRAQCTQVVWWLQVVAALRGEENLPWEGDLSGDVNSKLGALRAPVLAMLHRDPSLRPSMAAAHSSIIHMERT